MRTPEEVLGRVRHRLRISRSGLPSTKRRTRWHQRPERDAGSPGELGAHAVRDDLATGRLVAISVTGLELTRRLNAAWRDSAQPPAGPARVLVARAVRSHQGR